MDLAIQAFAAYLFDVDGTLLDSAADICGAVEEVLAKTPCLPFTKELFRRRIGYHFRPLFSKLLPDYTEQQIDDLIVSYRGLYLGRDHAATRVFPGVKEALAQLPGRKTTATTKGTPTTRAVLERFGLIEFFDHVQGTDGIPGKPEPDVLLAGMRALGAKPEESLMVGDSPADMEAGRRAGVKVCAVRYGYGDPEELARWSPDYWISDLRELLPVRGA